MSEAKFRRQSSAHLHLSCYLWSCGRWRQTPQKLSDYLSTHREMCKTVSQTGGKRGLNNPVQLHRTFKAGLDYMSLSPHSPSIKITFGYVQKVHFSCRYCSGWVNLQEILLILVNKNHVPESIPETPKQISIARYTSTLKPANNLKRVTKIRKVQ